MARVCKLIAYGPYGAGKSTFALSMLEYWRDVRKYKPEQCMLHVIDNDDGMEPLFGLVDPLWRSCIKFVLATSWPDLEEKTKKSIAECKVHQAKHGEDAAVLVVDNVGYAWSWTRDHHALQTYGMSEVELAATKRQEALAQGKKSLPTFNQRADYGIITPMHAKWADSIKMSGVGFIFLAPMSSWTDRGEDGTETTTIKPKGQGDNPGRVDQILKLYTEEDNAGMTTYWADLQKNRGAKYPMFRKMPNPTYAGFRRWLERQEAKALAALTAASKPVQAASPAPPVPASQPEQASPEPEVKTA